MTGRRRIAIISHGHPELSPGGGEQASYALFGNLKQGSDFDPLYLAWAPASRFGHSGDFATFRGRSDEVLWSPPALDGFRLTSLEPDRLRRQVRDLFSRIDADIVHLHHYWMFGTDLIPILSRELDIPVIVTLHEYLAICHNHGQMIKTSGRLCHASSYSECGTCFPDRSSGKFFVRRRKMLENFTAADLFISPSHFLAGRYVEWGLEPERLRVIENPLSGRYGGSGEVAPATPRPADGRGLRLGYFGQMSPFKGIEVLLNAIEMLDPVTRRRVKVVLFGSNIENQSDAFRTRIAGKVENLKDCVVSHGSYRNEDVLDLMRSVDWIVIPSIWWENSPVVIQEARIAGIPILCSNIGGMKEKVRPGVDGAHFIVANPMDLAEKITAICDGRLAVEPPGADEPAEASEEAPIERIVEAYRDVLVRREAARKAAEDGDDGSRPAAAE